MAAEQKKLSPARVLDQALELPGTVAPYYSYFHPYSMTNMIELYMQGAREIVGTRKQWATVGREIKPRSERYAIWVPRIIKRAVQDGAEGETEEILTGFSWSTASIRSRRLKASRSSRRKHPAGAYLRCSDVWRSG